MYSRLCKFNRKHRRAHLSCALCTVWEKGSGLPQSLLSSEISAEFNLPQRCSVRTQVYTPPCRSALSWLHTHLAKISHCSLLVKAHSVHTSTLCGHHTFPSGRSHFSTYQRSVKVAWDLRGISREHVTTVALTYTSCQPVTCGYIILFTSKPLVFGPVF